MCFKSSFEVLQWTATNYKEECFLESNELWLTSVVEVPFWSEEPNKNQDACIKHS